MKAARSILSTIIATTLAGNVAMAFGIAAMWSIPYFVMAASDSALSITCHDEIVGFLHDASQGIGAHGGYVPGEWFRPVGFDGWWLDVSYWLIIAIAGPTWLVQHNGLRERRRRVNEGSYVACGYYMTGNAIGVCLECGKRIHE